MPPLTLVIGNKNYSSWSLRPWLVLYQSGVTFEKVRIPLHPPEPAACSEAIPALQALQAWVADAVAGTDRIEKFERGE